MVPRVIQALVGPLVSRIAVALLIGLAAIAAYQHIEILGLRTERTQLRSDLRQALLSPRIVKQFVDQPVPYAVKTPIVVTVPGETKTLTVTVERVRDVLGPERIVTVAPPVFCPTRAECDAIYAHSEQVIQTDAHLRAGTVVSVLDGEVVRNLPLAKDFPVHLTLVQDVRGVFSGVGDPTNPLQPDAVTTSTALAPPPAPEKAWHYGVGIGASVMDGRAIAGPALEVSRRVGAAAQWRVVGITDATHGTVGRDWTFVSTLLVTF